MASMLFPSIAKPGTILSSYALMDSIGEGAFSVVKIGQCLKSGKEYAVKIIDKSSLKDAEGRAQLQREVMIMSNIQHFAIVAFRELFETSTHVHLVFEHLSGGELFDRIVEMGSYSEHYAAQAVQHVLSAVEYLHERDIVHRDLKPENLLYASPDLDAILKIVDFGLSKVMSAGDPLTTVCGTPGYCAPEVFDGKPYGKAVDMWAVGVITYIMLCGFEPFYEETDTAMFARILKCEYDFPAPYWDDISENAKDLVSSLIVKDPSKRLTAKQALAHPWVQGRAASTRNLPETHDRLKKFNARKKIRVAQNAVRAATRMLSFRRSSKDHTASTS